MTKSRTSLPVAITLPSSEVKTGNVYISIKIREEYFYNHSFNTEESIITSLINAMTNPKVIGDTGAGLYVSTNSHDSQYYGPFLVRLKLKENIEILEFKELLDAVNGQINKKEVVKLIETELSDYLKDKGLCNKRPRKHLPGIK